VDKFGGRFLAKKKMNGILSISERLGVIDSNEAFNSPAG
tara:strand:- start:1818 stop:1934 length:117 start_codon:yes stop_codon:yes gene_type:complete